MQRKDLSATDILSSIINKLKELQQSIKQRELIEKITILLGFLEIVIKLLQTSNRAIQGYHGVSLNNYIKKHAGSGDWDKKMGFLRALIKINVQDRASLELAKHVQHGFSIVLDPANGQNLLETIQETLKEIKNEIQDTLDQLATAITKYEKPSISQPTPAPIEEVKKETKQDTKQTAKLITATPVIKPGNSTHLPAPILVGLPKAPAPLIITTQQPTITATTPQPPVQPTNPSQQEIKSEDTASSSQPSTAVISPIKTNTVTVIEARTTVTITTNATTSIETNTAVTNTNEQEPLKPVPEEKDDAFIENASDTRPETAKLRSLLNQLEVRIILLSNPLSEAINKQSLALLNCFREQNKNAELAIQEMGKELLALETQLDQAIASATPTPNSEKQSTALKKQLVQLKEHHAQLSANYHEKAEALVKKEIEEKARAQEIEKKKKYALTYRAQAGLLLLAEKLSVNPLDRLIAFFYHLLHKKTKKELRIEYIHNTLAPQLKNYAENKVDKEVLNKVYADGIQAFSSPKKENDKAGQYALGFFLKTAQEHLSEEAEQKQDLLHRL